jgi:hypothetical protein
MKEFVKIIPVLFTLTFFSSCEKKSSPTEVVITEDPEKDFPIEKGKKVFSEITTLFSLTPLKEVKEFEVGFGTPEDLIIRALDNDKIVYINTQGSNSSGNFGGPSSVTLNFVDQTNQFSIETKNTTGSMYTGWEIWEDTYYFGPKDLANDLYVVDLSTDKEEPRYVVVSKNNPTSLMGTEGYTVEIIFKTNEPQYIAIGVFGADNAWSNYSRFWFKDSSEVESQFLKLFKYANSKNISELQ